MTETNLQRARRLKAEAQANEPVEQKAETQPSRRKNISGCTIL